MVKKTTSPSPGPRLINIADPAFNTFGDLELRIVGTAPLLMHAFGAKARRMMLDGQMGKKVNKRAPKVPENDFLDAIHFMGTPAAKASAAALKKARYGFPAVAFKAAVIRAAKVVAGVNMTDTRQMFFVDTDEGELVELECSVPHMREDVVRIQQTTDIRHRPQFDKWACNLRIKYNARAVTAEQLVTWFLAAGQSNGIGEWRPGGRSSSGTFGTFTVAEAKAFEPTFTEDVAA
jgi:hypothetical protein